MRPRRRVTRRRIRRTTRRRRSARRRAVASTAGRSIRANLVPTRSRRPRPTNARAAKLSAWPTTATGASSVRWPASRPRSRRSWPTSRRRTWVVPCSGATSSHLDHGPASRGRSTGTSSSNSCTGTSAPDQLLVHDVALLHTLKRRFRTRHVEVAHVATTWDASRPEPPFAVLDGDDRRRSGSAPVGCRAGGTHAGTRNPVAARSGSDQATPERPPPPRSCVSGDERGLRGDRRGDDLHRVSIRACHATEASTDHRGRASICT